MEEKIEISKVKNTCFNYEVAVCDRKEIEEERKQKIKRDLINKIIYELGDDQIEEMNDWANWDVSWNKTKILCQK